METVREAFQENLNPFLPDEAILQLLSLTLYNNNFEFNSLFYLQLSGIAIGRKYAPSTSNIYLKKFDHAAVNHFHIHPLLYSRFLDDIFGILPGTKSELLLFQNFLNSIIPGIKVTLTIRHQIIDFIDTQIYKKNTIPMAHAFSILKSSLNLLIHINFFTVLHFTQPIPSNRLSDPNSSVLKESPLPSMTINRPHPVIHSHSRAFFSWLQPPFPSKN